MATVIDYAAGVPSASAVRAAGHIGAVRYISPDRTGGKLPAKPVRVPEIEDFHREGLEMAFVWQFGKDADADTRRGRSGGLQDARSAQVYLNEIRCPSNPVFFAVDFDMTLDQWNSFGVEYFRAACEILGRDRVGIYGHSRVCAWAIEDGVVADLGGGRGLCWVTKAWSGGERGENYAVLYQGVFEASVDGVGVDVNEVLYDYWGQYPPSALDTDNSVEVVPVADSAVDIDESHKIAFGKPTSLPKRVIFVHTTENYLGTPASNVIDYQVRMRNGSYHRLVDFVDGRARIVLANTDDWQVWATGNIGNDIALHVSVVWMAKTTREEWLAEPELLKAVARVIAYWSRTYDIPLKKLTAEELAAGEWGVAGHLEAQVWGNTDHWDPGYGFPYDVVLDIANKINNSPAEVVQVEQDFMEELMSKNIQSLVNPNKAFPADVAMSIIDSTAWETRVAVRGLYEALGLDFDGFIEASKAADIAGEEKPSIKGFTE